MAQILGLELGTASIGWAIAVDENSNSNTKTIKQKK